MDKSARQRIIKEIVASRPIKTQKDLVAALISRGVAVTQATVSRDITEIPLDRARTADGQVYQWRGWVGGPADRLARTVRESVVSIERAQNLVVIKTGPGQAAPLAVCLDETGLSNVLGTIAGDDTILVVGRDGDSGIEVKTMLEKLME